MMLWVWLLGCPSPGTEVVDADGDGAPAGVDCDDGDAAVHPGADDAWYDGIDADCAGNDDFDADADGAPRDADCDDADPATRPGAPEVWYDGIDEDCAGGSDWDADGDGFSAPGAPEGIATDCDDADPLANPSVVVNATPVITGIPSDVDETATTYGLSAVLSVSEELPLDQHHATVAWGPDGRWLSTWQAGKIGYNPVAARRLFDDVQAVAPQQLVEDIGRMGVKPDVEAWPGGYVVAWEEGGGPHIWLRGFDVDGKPVTEPILAHTGTSCEAPDLALQPDGSGVVVWDESGGDAGDGEHLYLRFGPDLQPIGDAVVVEKAGRTVAEAAARADGGFVMVATRNIAGEENLEVYGRVIEGNGCEINFRADQGESEGPSRPTLDVDPTGRFVVSWRAKVSEGVGDGAYARFFAPDATPLSDSIALSLPGEGANRAVVAWWEHRAVFSWEGDLDPSDAVAADRVAMWVWDADAMAPVSARIALSDNPDYSAERPAVSVFDHGDGTADLVTTWENVGPQVRVVARIVGLTE